MRIPDLKSFLHIVFTWELRIYFKSKLILIPIAQIKWGTENLNLEAIFNLMKLFSESTRAAYISFYLTSTS